MAKKTMRGNSGPKPVESIKHKDKRTNIPTEELRDFVAEDEQKPKTMFYPRDPSLDPQLVWRGKDEQDQKDLAVPVVPIYIQEKIHPQALIENLRDTAKAGEKEPEQLLFSDFNGIDDDFERKIDFYSHDLGTQPKWTNRLILGDSLLVMTSLAEKEGLKGKVQTIYFDPPYGIRFGSNWQVSTRKRNVADGKAEDTTRQPEQIRAFRDTWKIGVHSYLAYLRDRLIVARELLTETGSVFLQIGDENVHLVRCLIDEVFGSENFVTFIPFAKTAGMADKYIGKVFDTILWYAKDIDRLKYRQLFLEKTPGEVGALKYDSAVSTDGQIRRLSSFTDESLMEGWEVVSIDPMTSQEYRPDTTVSFSFQGRTYHPGDGSHWKTSVDGLGKLDLAGRLIRQGNQLRYIRKMGDFPVYPLNNLWPDIGGVQSRSDPKIYVVQTSTTAIERCVLMSSDPGDLVLDPTCGSGTTAYVAEEWGRRWTTIDTSRVALALARTRLMTARYPYYLLADSPEGITREAELTGKIPPSHRTENDIRKGLVYKRVPHVTLRSIANNPEIKEGMTRKQIDAAIARHAEQETLYDQPYEDPRRIRVAGPFTVESLSPHRVLATDEDQSATEGNGRREAGDFATMIIDNLRKAGVQNTKRNERLKFDRLDSFAGTWIHATGDFTDSDGKTKRVAVSLGPEHGTVGPQQVKEAAKEAVQGLGYDLLVVCGFAFDPHVSEEAKRYGKLTVLPARMNPDLAMGEELLKKTGAANLFMVFGEPDVEIKKQKDGKLTVEIRGVDVYDPTTGQIRSSSTDDIACWFIDTQYNGESFFVRHAYFLGADEPYEKLNRALRADIDEGAWSSLYSNVSRPFARPATGKIAVKVINHYGDELLHVYEV
jgi:adenine-specific DNA-methyltransferase